jgi:hypothetical protein
VKKHLWLSLPIVVGSWFVVASGPPVLASCAGLPIPIGQALGSASLVFVGTVMGTSDGDRTARVHVDELWRGASLPAEVTVHGGPDESAAATSVDRHYDNGKRYLFVPASAGGNVFDDNSCSMTREFTSDLETYRPASSRRYPPAAAGPPVAPIAAGVLVMTAAAVTGLILRRRNGASAAPRTEDRGRDAL